MGFVTGTCIDMKSMKGSFLVSIQAEGFRMNWPFAGPCWIHEFEELLKKTQVCSKSWWLELAYPSLVVRLGPQKHGATKATSAPLRPSPHRFDFLGMGASRVWLMALGRLS